jgi:hypothetical protein
MWIGTVLMPNPDPPSIFDGDTEWSRILPQVLHKLENLIFFFYLQLCKVTLIYLCNERLRCQTRIFNVLDSVLKFYGKSIDLLLVEMYTDPDP